MEKTLKNILKTIKLNESNISMFLGIGVVLVVGGVILNYFRLRPAELPTLNDQSVEQIADEAEKEEFSETPAEELPPFAGELPTNYKVREGDNLWEIAERYYQTGYGWTEIAEANQLASADLIENDQELTIPQLAKAYPQTVEISEPAVGGAGTTTITDQEDGDTEIKSDAQESITGDSYTVQKGDNLWKISERAYEDGFNWTEIAEANDLDNPRIIHVGLELNLPR